VNECEKCIKYVRNGLLLLVIVSFWSFCKVLEKYSQLAPTKQAQ